MNSIAHGLVLILVLNWNVHGREWLVGSSTEIKSVLSDLKPGDVVVMKSGRWHDQKIRFTANGTAQKPILLKAQKAGQTRLTGKSRLHIYGTYLVVDGLLFTEG
ncbi:uncharacterized protein METZ01_LOCUS493636, partial [marine metagenome]